MPNLRKIALTFTLAATFFVNVNAQQAPNSSFSDAVRHFELLSYPTAIQKFEKILKEEASSLSEADKTSLFLKLAFSYKKVNNDTNAEKYYREALKTSPKLEGDDLKTYLYFAQSLAANGKFKESQVYLDKYNAFGSSINKTNAELSTNQKLNKDVTRLKTDKGKYTVEYLTFNSDKPEFSPIYYKSGLVFCSGRSKGTLSANKKGGFLDLYYLSDLSMIKGIVEDEENTQPKQKVAGNLIASLGNDYYSQPTANDSKTLSFFGGADKSAVISTEQGQIAESDIFSKTLNTKLHEGPTTFSNDFSKIIFTRNNFNEGEQGRSEDNVTKLKLYTADNSKGIWSNPVELPFNGDDFSTAHPTLSKDGRYLYFASDRPNGFGGMDLWMAENVNGKWTEPKNLGKDINTKSTDAFPFVDENGNLYYSTEGLGGDGGLDIFFVEMKKGMPVGKPFNIGEPFNSVNDDFGIITDGERSSGFFSSDRRKGVDDDIYRFKRQSSLYDCKELTISVIDPDNHKKPVVDAQISLTKKGNAETTQNSNTSGLLKICTEANLDYQIRVSKDGYITNIVGYSTKGETGDAPSIIEVPLTRITIIESEGTVIQKLPEAPIPQELLVAKPKVTVLRGFINKGGDDKVPVEGVLLTMKNLCDGSEQTNMTGADGKYAFELIPGCDFELNAFKDGYIDLTNPISSDEIEDTLNTDENKPVSTIKVNKIKRGKPKVISKNIDLVEVGDFITINKIFNDKLSTQISGEATNELNKLVATLRHHPAMMIEVGSHIDSKGDASDNLQLTQRRSNSIVDYMVGKGIERSRMIPKGYGESMLVNKCRDGIVCTEREHERNRRTTIRILKIRSR
ncbi:MAG: OmpA family protein [Spirosomataceae bacterium]